MMNTHPIHIHGHEFLVTRKGGKGFTDLPNPAKLQCLLHRGETRDIEFIADNQGIGLFLS